MSAYSVPRDIVLRQAISRRETGLKKMAARHAEERMRKEQELLAARAELEALLRDKEQA